ncbi:MAG: hypothetical protein Fur0035_07550 [Anaerolineales bacterium]
MRFLTLIFLTLALTACQAAPATEALPTLPPSRTPGGPTSTPIAFLPASTQVPADEILRFSGADAPDGQSAVFTLTAPTTLRVNWREYSEGLFQIFVSDPNQSDPAYRQVSMALSRAPSEGFTDYLFAPGSYSVRVESASADWEVWVERLR